MKVADLSSEHTVVHHAPVGKRWSVATIDELRVKPWQDLKKDEKTLFAVLLTVRFISVVFILFFYICSLAQIATAFSLIGSRGLGAAIKDSPLIHDPISALILGMVATVVLQSPTTTTTILVSMVAANMITVHTAIPVMIGSEMGSSLVNAFVSMAYSGNNEQFRRAFAAATLGDIFNFCSLTILLPLELFTSVIEKTSWLIVDPLVAEQGMSFKTLDALTDPFNHMILQVNEAEIRNATVSPDLYPSNHTFIYRCAFDNGSRIPNCPYAHIFAYSSFSDTTVGWIVLLFSIVVMILSLCGVVHLVSKMLGGRMARVVRNLLERECPGRFQCFTGYIVMFVGLIVTVMVQSNSIFASSLTPLAGLGVISLEKMYPLTLGSNIGTTFTGVLAAMSADGSRFEKTLHMAMCQVIYNVLGTLLFYIIPWTRRIPLFLARRLGNATAEYRWFIFVYIIGLFVLLPAVIFLLSLGPDYLVIVFVLSMGVFVAVIVFINYLQVQQTTCLPTFLQTWDCVPRPFRSFQYWDDIFLKCCGTMPILGRFVQRRESHGSVSSGSIRADPKLDKLTKLTQFTTV